MSIEVVEISPINSTHSQLLVFLACVLKLAADSRDAGLVLAAPFVMKATPEIDLMPDMQLVMQHNVGRIGDKYLDGPADIAIEIVAEGSDPEERESSLADYDEAGVREYWIIDPEHKVAKFFHRDAEKKLVAGRVGDSGIYRSKVLPELWVKVGWFWESPPPKALVIMREWRLI